MNLYYVPAGNAEARKHLEESIVKGIPLNVVSPFIDNSVIDEISQISCSDTLKLWGITPGKFNTNKWNELQKGDRVLICSQGMYIYYGTVVTKIQNKQLAEYIWGWDSSNRTWEYIFFLKDITRINISYKDFNEAVGYDIKFIPQGFNAIKQDRLQQILEKNGDIDTLVARLDKEPIARFVDYIQQLENSENGEWVTIFEKLTEKNDDMNNDLFTFCALINNSEEDILKYLSKEDWDFNIGSFGRSYFAKEYSEGKEEIKLISGDKYEEYEYLVAYRLFNEKYEPEIEINPKLIWYNNLVYVNGKYIDPLTEEVVIKKNSTSIKVRRKYLRDFLSAYNKACIISFDHRRYFESPHHPKYQKVYKNNNSNYSIQIIPQNPVFGSSETTYLSMMFGKIIVIPFDKVRHRDLIEFTGGKSYEEFIIGVNSNGDPILHTCYENELRNYFGENPNAPHYLTPVYFLNNVLDKYINNSVNYKIVDGHVRFLDEWSLPFSIDTTDRITVWLGDLGRIPYSEQKHWKAHNTITHDKVKENSVEKKSDLVYVDNLRPENRLIMLIKRINTLIDSKYDDYLLIPLTESDKRIENTFVIPQNNSFSMFQLFLLELHDLVIERLNIKLLNKLLDINKSNATVSLKSARTITLLDLFLKNELYYHNNEFTKSLETLNIVRNLVVHNGSIESYNQIWGRDPKYVPNFILDSTLMLDNINNSLQNLVDFLEMGA